MASVAPAPAPDRPGSERASALPRDAGRATEVLYRRHGVTVFRYAWHLLGRREDAEDATQATFLAVHSALAGGAAVLEPRSWVLAITRNECMTRLRGTSRRPLQDALADDSGATAEGSVESAAELRDELRIARRTLLLLPERQREAFVLREWLGLEVAEVSLALGLASAEVEQLTARARRSLVLAVGGLEPAAGCAATRAALAAGSLDRAGKVHMLRCPLCRGVRRALRPRGGAAAPAPSESVARRLAGILPGFGAGGGALAALASKTAAAPVITKAAALVVAGLLASGAVGEAVRSSHPSHPSHHRVAAPAPGRGGAASPARATGGRASTVSLDEAPAAPPEHARAAGTVTLARIVASQGSRGGGSATTAGARGDVAARPTTGHARDDSGGRAASSHGHDGEGDGRTAAPAGASHGNATPSGDGHHTSVSGDGASRDGASAVPASGSRPGGDGSRPGASDDGGGATGGATPGNDGLGDGGAATAAVDDAGLATAPAAATPDGSPAGSDSSSSPGDGADPSGDPSSG